MRLLPLAMLLLLPTLALVPTVSAQAVSAEGCVRMCDPLDPTVNPRAPSRQLAWVFMYANLPGHADLTLVRPTTRLTATYEPSIALGSQGCHLFRWQLGDATNLTSIDPNVVGNASQPAAPFHVLEGGALYVYVRIPQETTTDVPATFTVTIREGIYGGETVLARGSLDAALSGLQLWEVRVPIEATREKWAYEERQYNRGFEVELVACLGNANATLPLPLELVTGPHTPSRLLLQMSQLMTTNRIRATVLDDHVRIDFQVQSAFGSYDVDIGSARIELVGRHAREAWTPLMAPPLRDLHPNHSDTPVTFRWLVNRSEFFPNTRYEIRADVTNLQGTYLVEATVPYESIVLDGRSRIPSIGAVVAVLVLAFVSAAVRPALRK